MHRLGPPVAASMKPGDVVPAMTFLFDLGEHLLADGANADILGSTPVPGVGFGVSPKQSLSEFVKVETLSPAPETSALP